MANNLRALPNPITNQPFVVADIVNRSELNTYLDEWFAKYYYDNSWFEALFGWQLATSINESYRRKDPTRYKITNAQGWNGETKPINYSYITYRTEKISLDTIFSAGRKLSPIENDWTPGLLTADMRELINAEMNERRVMIMNALQTPGVATNVIAPFPIPTDRDKFLAYYDTLVDQILSNGMNPERTVVLCDTLFFRAIRNFLQLTLGANDQVNKVLGNRFSWTKTIEGIIFVLVPSKYDSIDEDGNVIQISLFKAGIHAIAFERGPNGPLIARYKDHTGLRIGEAAVGSGQGAKVIMEWVRVYGVDVIEPKKVIVMLEPTAVVKVDLAFLISAMEIDVVGPATLVDFQAKVINLIQAQNQFYSLTIADVDFFKADGTTPLTQNDISNGIVNIVVKAKAGSLLFTGQKAISVNTRVYDNGTTNF